MYIASQIAPKREMIGLLHGQMKLDVRHLYLRSNLGRYLKDNIMGNMIIREITGETEQRNVSLFSQCLNIPEV